MRSVCVAARMHGSAMGAGALLRRLIERGEERGEILDNVYELYFDTMHKAVAFQAIPFEAVDCSRCARAFDYQTSTSFFGALRRMPQMRR
jgi:hypothetical protein